MQISRRLDGASIDVLEETPFRFRLPRQGLGHHRVGRVRSRKQALRSVNARRPRRDLERDAILVHVASASRQGLAVEAPEAYKDVDAVVEAAEGAGLSRPMARLAPLGVVKG